MERTIDFNDNVWFSAIEIDYKSFDIMLASESQPIELIITKFLPEKPFGVCGFAPHFSGYRLEYFPQLGFSPPQFYFAL